MNDFRSTRLWKSAFIPRRESSANAESRDRLRRAYLSFRDRVAVLVNQIALDLPQLTVHDITHCDALWTTADLIAGSLELTPAETFVLGGAILIHDSALSLAAYPKGLDSLKQLKAWADTVAILLKIRSGKRPTKLQLENPGPEIECEAIQSLLRELHANQAEVIPITPWRDESTAEQYYLLEDTDLRQYFGRLIGNIASSHWRSVESLGVEFCNKLGAPSGFPPRWEIDPLRVAALLRVADAAQIDSERAPGFLKVLRRPTGISEDHWVFQQRMNQPRLEGDRLVYTSNNSFSTTNAAAWWLCFDTLTMIDRELRSTDALLSDLSRTRFAAKGVLGVEDPGRLARLVSTEGWLPVDARLRVGDVASLVRRLGGEALYGGDLTVPLRELIQNASDAVRARRILERRPSDWGDVTVRIGEDSLGYWVEVRDNGVGMSSRILTGPFLDFGNSLWGSSLIQSEFPGLASSGFTSTGKYGIGFFSVFMWGDRVRVTTRRADTGVRDTLCLEFADGLRSRPLLRPLPDPQELHDGGTVVRVWLNTPPHERNGFLWQGQVGEAFAKILKLDTRDVITPLPELVEFLCPALDVNVYVELEGGECRRLVIAASDWLTMSNDDFLRRVWGRRAKREDLANCAKNVRTIVTQSGEVVGRACVAPSRSERGRRGEVIGDGSVTDGGLRASTLIGIAGVLLGTCSSVRRDTARLLVEPQDLAVWATDQGKLLEADWQAEGVAFSGSRMDLRDAVACSAVIRLCGGMPAMGLPIAIKAGRWLTASHVAQWKEAPQSIIVIQQWDLEETERVSDTVTLGPNVLVVPSNLPDSLCLKTVTFAESADHEVSVPPVIALLADAFATAWSVNPSAVTISQGSVDAGKCNDGPAWFDAYRISHAAQGTAPE